METEVEMRLILSRKGFDSSAGGGPSPIFPDGRIVSLPIPDKQSPIRYEDIKFEGQSIAPLVSDLSKERIKRHYGAHLDPDLFPGSLPRLDEWRQIFGQTGAAQSHLCKNGVGPGDIFLFFGLFRWVVFKDGKYTWMKGSKPVHVIWGWLQIGEILPVDSDKRLIQNWASYHPHCHRGPDRSNVLYISSKRLSLSGGDLEDIGGGGIFQRFSSSLQLTAPSALNPTLWELPEWFFPGNGRKPLTYHADLRRWRRSGNGVEVRAASRGQEFILDCDEYPEAIAWLSSLISNPLITPRKL